MKKILFVFILMSTLSCNSKQKKVDNIVGYKNDSTTSSMLTTPALIIGERIDGPANIRNKPNGEVIFTLKDNSLIDHLQANGDWYEILIYADLKQEEFDIDSIKKNRPIIANKDTIGKTVKSFPVSTGGGSDYAYAMLHGYTHKNNIKPETVIETIFCKKLKTNNLSFSDWTTFIRQFSLESDAIDFDELESYYNYENDLNDPSPGFRIVLLFKDKTLIGLIHSRDLELNNATTYKLEWSYYITFFNNYAKEQQVKFIEYMNEWIQGVD